MPKNIHENVNWEIEYNNFQHEEYYSIKHPYHEKYKKLFNIINYWNPDWIHKYNKFFLNKCDITDVCKNYIDSLEFCLYYYLGSVKSVNLIDWKFYYKYRVPPTFYDLNNYLNDHLNDHLKVDVTEKYIEPLSPYEQLIMVLPKEYTFLLPRSIKKNILNSVNYETNLKLDIVYGQKFIYSDIIVNNFQIDFTNLIDDKTLTDIEKYRNNIEDSYLMFVKN